jgi:hypothetical protein
MKEVHASKKAEGEGKKNGGWMKSPPDGKAGRGEGEAGDERRLR